MSGPPPSRALLVALSASLAVALVVIAFLLGRESTRPSAADSNPQAPPLVVEPEPIVESTEQRRWPEWADLEKWEDVEDPAFDAQPVHEPIEHRRDGTFLRSNHGSTGDAPQITSDSPVASTGSEVSDYFLRVDAIHSESGAGDPNTFAMGLIKAGLGGSTAGFDRLIADTQRMEQEIGQVTPPPSCIGYHEANLKALAESREVLQDMKVAFADRDFSSLTAIARKAGTLQAKAKDLQDMRERIVADGLR